MLPPFRKAYVAQRFATGLSVDFRRLAGYISSLLFGITNPELNIQQICNLHLKGITHSQISAFGLWKYEIAHSSLVIFILCQCFSISQVAAHRLGSTCQVLLALLFISHAGGGLREWNSITTYL